nr:unnamed protein product [Spirometra erinaceieuropaei]
MVDNVVPQGSVLGPLLFLIYVDDAARALDGEVTMFADDMKIWSVESRNFLQRLEMMLFRGYRLAPLRFVISHTQTAPLGTAAFPVDLNHVTLLGSVASNGVTIESWKGDRELAVFNLLTRARYRSADRFLMKLVYHRIHVFDQPLINRIRGLCQGDRVCVIGALTSFRKSSNDWMQCITAQNVILHGAAGQEVEPPAEDLAGTADEP